LEFKLKLVAPGLPPRVNIFIAARQQLGFSFIVFRTFLKYWLPVVLWMTIIFSASSDTHSQQHSSRFFEPLLHWLFPSMSQTRVETIHHYFRKCCHLAEYAVLGLLVWRALHGTKSFLAPWSWPKVGGTLLVVFLYAATDEFHQVFVPGRTPMISDVFIDTAGASIGLLGLWIVHLRKR